jgi:hypothetical protein
MLPINIVRDDEGYPIPFKDWFIEVSPMMGDFNFTPDELAEVYYETHTHDGKDKFLSGKEAEVLYVYVDERFAK